MCVRHKLNREKGYMTMEFYKRLLEYNLDINRIVFCHFGEPLLHPDIGRMIHYAAQRGIITELNTNGILLNGTKAEEIINSGINSIVFSFEGINKEEYEKIRLGARYELVLNNIINFLELRQKYKKNRVSVSIDSIDFNYSAIQKVDFKKKILSLGVDSVNFIPLHVWPVDDNEENLSNSHKSNNRYYGCFLPWIMISILWDGKVVACCDDFDGINVITQLGQNMSIYTIWNNREMVSLREKLLRRIKTNGLLCSNCYRVSKSPWSYPFINRIKREIKEIFL